MVNVGFFEPHLKNMDLVCGLIGIVLGLIIAIISVFGVINQLLIGLAILLVSSIYVFIRPKIRSQREIAPVSIPPRILSMLDIIFWSLLSIALLIWHSNLYYRPVSYFIIISILSAIIALEIFSTHNSHRFWPIFFKIVVLSLVIRGGIYFNYPSVMGYDAYLHTKIADFIMLTGSVPPLEISGKYVYAPIVHALIASVGVFCQIPVKYAVFLSIGIGSVLSTLFLYIIGKHIAGPQIGLLAVLLANLTNDLIVRGITNITAGSLVICYLLVMLYLVFADIGRLNARDSLLIFLSLLLVITHQLTTFAVFFIMVTLISSQAIISYIRNIPFQRRRYIVYLTLFGIAIISYWMSMELSTESAFFDWVLEPFIDTLNTGGKYGSDLLIVGRAYEQPLLDRLILQLSYLILPFFAIGGLLLWISPENRERFTIAVVAGVMFVMVYGIPLLGIRDLLTSRWMPLLCIFLALLAAAFLVALINMISSKRWKLCSIVIIIGLFTLLMINTPAINRDNPLVNKDGTCRNQFTPSEIAVAEKIGSVYDGALTIDATFWGAYIYHSNPAIDKYANLKKQIDIYESFDLKSITLVSGKTLFILRTSTQHEPISVKASELHADSIARTIPEAFFDGFETSECNLIYNSQAILGYL